jgi:hypothetical protein
VLLRKGTSNRVVDGLRSALATLDHICCGFLKLCPADSGDSGTPIVDVAVATSAKAVRVGLPQR